MGVNHSGRPVPEKTTCDGEDDSWDGHGPDYEIGGQKPGRVEVIALADEEKAD